MIEVNMTIKMDEGEKIECPCCGEMHKIKIEDVCVSVGTCEDCEMEIIVEATERTKGTQQ